MEEATAPQSIDTNFVQVGDPQPVNGVLTTTASTGSTVYTLPGTGSPIIQVTDLQPVLDVSYAKSLGTKYTETELRDLLSVKKLGNDKIFHYAFLWGNPDQPDLDAEFFTPETDLWDNIMGKSARPLTWDHAQDPTMKANPVIGQTVEWGDDELGRWALSHLDRAHAYRKAIDALIEKGVIGTSSDSAPQYVERVQRGKSIWLKTWPWFASALTDVPCEHRMIGTVDYFKSIGISVPNPVASVTEQTRYLKAKADRVFKTIDVFGE